MRSPEKRRPKERRSARQIRRVNADDTPVVPLPDTLARRRLWMLLGVVLLLVLAASLTVVRL